MSYNKTDNDSSTNNSTEEPKITTTKDRVEKLHKSDEHLLSSEGKKERETFFNNIEGQKQQVLKEINNLKDNLKFITNEIMQTKEKNRATKTILDDMKKETDNILIDIRTKAKETSEELSSIRREQLIDCKAAYNEHEERLVRERGDIIQEISQAKDKIIQEATLSIKSQLEQQITNILREKRLKYEAIVEKVDAVSNDPIVLIKSAIVFIREFVDAKDIDIGTLEGIRNKLKKIIDEKYKPELNDVLFKIDAYIDAPVINKQGTCKTAEDTIKSLRSLSQKIEGVSTLAISSDLKKDNNVPQDNKDTIPSVSDNIKGRMR